MKAVGRNVVILPVKETETKTKGGLLLAEAPLMLPLKGS